MIQPGDISLIIYLMVGVMFAMFALQFIYMILPYLQFNRRSFIERPNDAHSSLYKKRKKAAKRNVANTNLKRIVMLGESDYPSQDYGRLIGIYWHRTMAEVFFKHRRIEQVKWAIIPRELIRDTFKRNLRIEANGLEPVGNWYRPIYTSDISRQDQERYDDLIFQFEKALMLHEKSVEVEEQGVHVLEDSVDVHRYNKGITEREDHVRPTQVDRSREEEYYDREESFT